MARRQWTVTLEDHERKALLDAVDGRAIEYVLRRLRAALTAGRDTVNNLAKSKDSITNEQITAARQALADRRELLHQLPEVVDAELIRAATDPIEAGITECDRLVREELDGEAAPSGAASSPTPVNGAAVPTAPGPAGEQHP